MVVFGLPGAGGERVRVGNGDLVVNKAFTWSGPVAAIASVGVARSAYEYALSWAKKYTGGGDKPIIDHQIVAYTLAEVAMKVEAGRAFAWKAAHYHDLHNADGHAIGPMAKVFCSEMLFNAVFQAMKVVGVNALDKTIRSSAISGKHPCFRSMTPGNVGMQMRKICAVMADPAFDPRAIAASAATPFGKQAPPPAEIQAVGRNLKRQA